MTPKNGHRPLIPYLRQSRAKEKTISLEEQRRVITTWAKANKVELAPEVVEQGVSGSKDWRERALGAAMSAVEGGEAQGVVVAFQDRLSRENGLATAEVWQALETAEARLVCAGEGLDTATGDHEMLFSIKAAIAREQWKRHKANWQAARRNAVERGIHVSSTLPAGYSRDPETKRLVRNEHSDAITEAFEARAKGASWTRIAVMLSEAGVPTSHQLRGTTDPDLPWTGEGVARLLANRAYLGEARSGEFVNPKAHPPLVSPALWARVQARKQQPGDYSNPNREKALLQGLVVCATCGNKMRKDTTRRDGKVYPFLRCKSASRCTSRASIGVDRLERHVFEEVVRRAVFPPPAPQGEGQSKAYQDALSRVEAATEALETTLATWRTQGLSAESIGRMVVDLERERDEAVEAVNAIPVRTEDATWDKLRKAVGRTNERLGLSESLDANSVIKKARLKLETVQAEGLSGDMLGVVFQIAPKALQRDMLTRALASIVVKPGRAPVEERVTVTLKPGFVGA